MADRDTWKFTVRHQCRGRALLVLPDGTFYIGRGQAIYRSTDDGRTWKLAARLPTSLVRRGLAHIRLACRLLRHEVKAMAVLSNGALVACNRQGVYHAAPRGHTMLPSKITCDGPPAKPPMTLNVGPGDRVTWGEYNSKTGHGLPIRIFVSEDAGAHYRAVHTSAGGDVLHVHSVFFDTQLGHYWVLTGDFDNEPGIGKLAADFSHFEWLARGRQQFRAVEVFDCGPFFVYGTDTQLEENHIVRLNKADATLETLQKTDGSCIYACRFGGLYVLSTSVEPSSINPSETASLWVSGDGIEWNEVYSAEKDSWHPVYFQFGSLVLPRGGSERETVLLSGQALRGIDGNVIVADITPRSTPQAKAGGDAPPSFTRDGE